MITGELVLDRRLDDPLHLLHVVDVERADAVAALGGLVEHLTQRRKWHRSLLSSGHGQRILTREAIA